jgi:hypothetical protein
MECLLGDWETLEDGRLCRFTGTVRFLMTSMARPEDPTRVREACIVWEQPTPVPFAPAPLPVPSVSTEEFPEEDPNLLFYSDSASAPIPPEGFGPGELVESVGSRETPPVPSSEESSSSTSGAAAPVVAAVTYTSSSEEEVPEDLPDPVTPSD